MRHSVAASDSDSDYGARSKKKKRVRVPDNELRMSSRGGRIPNYKDDVQDFEQFDEDEVLPVGNYAQAAPQEEEEIEAVLGHLRDEEVDDDGEDNWYTNIVSGYILSESLTGN